MIYMIAYRLAAQLCLHYATCASGQAQTLLCEGQSCLTQQLSRRLLLLGQNGTDNPGSSLMCEAAMPEAADPVHQLLPR